MKGKDRNEIAVVRAHYPVGEEMIAGARYKTEPRHRVIVVRVKDAPPWKNEVVTLQVHTGERWISGSCMGRWRDGLLVTGIPNATRADYLREKFGPLEGLAPNDFRILDRLYRDAIADLPEV